MPMCGTFPAAQGLDFTFQYRGCGLDPWWGSQDPTCLLATKPEHKQQKQYCNKFNKDFKSGPHQKNLKKKIPMSIKLSISHGFMWLRESKHHKGI